MAWTDAARAAAAEARRRNKILNAPVSHLVRNKSGMLVIRKRAPSQRFKNDVLKKVKSNETLMYGKRTNAIKRLWSGLKHK